MRRLAVGLAGVVLTAGSLALVGAAPAGATTVTDEASFRTAWQDTNETQIDLANDINFTTPTCTNGAASRNSGNPLTVNGNGHTITLCSNLGGVLQQSGVGALTFENVTVKGGTSTSNGGAIFTSGPVTVSNSTFTNNTGSGAGGAIITSAPVTVSNSTFTNNTSGTNGGAIVTGSSVTVTNSTFTNNTAAAGGAIFAAGGVTVAYSTLTGNVAPNGSAINYLRSSLTLFASVLATPGGTGSLCSGASTSLGYNYANETANSCALTATGDSSLDANAARLGPLASNGGPTQTQLPQSGSPLIDTIPNAACQTAPLATGITTDQRGLARPEQAGGKCDIGAVEVPPSPVVVLQPKFTG